MIDVVKFGLFLVFFSVCGSLLGDQTLVLLDNFSLKETHSIFFKNLELDGHTLTYRLADDSNLKLNRYGEYLYDNVVIFSTNVEEFGGNIDVANLVQFIDDGYNVLIATGSRVGSAVRELAIECGVEIDDKNTDVIDHFNSIQSLQDGTNRAVVVPVTNLINSKVIVGDIIDDRKAKLAYRGSALLLDGDNQLVMPVLKASKSAFSYDVNKEFVELKPLLSSPTLIAAMKARNNARVLISGSLDFFTDEFLSLPGYANSPVSQALARWTFQKSGVLRVNSISHHRTTDGSTPDSYTIMDDVVYRIEIDEKHTDGQWRPFVSTDLQLEFVRIDPFVRIFLAPISTAGVFEAQFRIPDVYGVYKFKIDYNRMGYTSLANETQVSVRPLLHTQYERFILSAYPYYASAFSMMCGLFLFTFVFLYSSFDGKSEKKEK